VEVAKFTTAEKSASSSHQCQVHVDRFFYIKGIVHKEFLPPGQTVNGKFYCDILKRLRESIRCKRPDKWKNNNWFLHHDNAPAHTSLVRQFLVSKNTTVIPHPLFARPRTCDFFLFPKMKLRLKGRRFDTIEEIHAESQEVLNTHLRTSRDAWNHGKNAGIAVYMPKGTTLKETVETRS
jgi:hypothetical protein